MGWGWVRRNFRESRVPFLLASTDLNETDRQTGSRNGQKRRRQGRRGDFMDPLSPYQRTAVDVMQCISIYRNNAPAGLYGGLLASVYVWRPVDVGTSSGRPRNGLQMQRYSSWTVHDGMLFRSPSFIRCSPRPVVDQSNWKGDAPRRQIN